MNPVSNTAFYCCGVRMLDAEQKNPVCGDEYAHLFMNEQGKSVFEAFKKFKGPNASNTCRHRIIDDMICDELMRNPDLLIVLIGAGFDTRAYRIDGGKWIEIDEQPVIEYKNSCLPEEKCMNFLRRIPVDFSVDSMDQILAPYTKHKQVLFVIEGVFMYLDEKQINVLLDSLKRVFPKHKLVCDLMTKQFFDKYARRFHENITRLGTSFTLMNDPVDIFLQHGYHEVNSESTIRHAVKHGLMKVPGFILDYFLKTLASGYCVYQFKNG